MVRRANKQGFALATIHDSFHCLPNHGNEVRQNYIDILCEIADSNLLSDILNNITKSTGTISKYTSNLSSYIALSEYALS